MLAFLPRMMYHNIINTSFNAITDDLKLLRPPFNILYGLSEYQTSSKLGFISLFKSMSIVRLLILSSLQWNNINCWWRIRLIFFCELVRLCFNLINIRLH